ncbi:MAG: hypothetical protein P4L16_08445 [Chlamydiales bacterium]|nr:hypothetical protein [Chlamydiales bacterium]
MSISPIPRRSHYTHNQNSPYSKENSSCSRRNNNNGDRGGMIKTRFTTPSPERADTIAISPQSKPKQSSFREEDLSFGELLKNGTLKIEKNPDVRWASEHPNIFSRLTRAQNYTQVLCVLKKTVINHYTIPHLLSNSKIPWIKIKNFAHFILNQNLDYTSRKNALLHAVLRAEEAKDHKAIAIFYNKMEGYRIKDVKLVLTFINIATNEKMFAIARKAFSYAKCSDFINEEIYTSFINALEAETLNLPHTFYLYNDPTAYIHEIEDIFQDAIAELTFRELTEECPDAKEQRSYVYEKYLNICLLLRNFKYAHIGYETALERKDTSTALHSQLMGISMQLMGFQETRKIFTNALKDEKMDKVEMCKVFVEMVKAITRYSDKDLTDIYLESMMASNNFEGTKMLFEMALEDEKANHLKMRETFMQIAQKHNVFEITPSLIIMEEALLQEE